MKVNTIIWITIIIIVITLKFPVIVVGSENITITYVSSVDPDLGFYKITDSTLHNKAPYINRILTINQGDTVIWKNDADKPNNITIVSDQKLFKDKLLRLIDDVSTYMFDRPGKYEFYVKERQTLRQIIIVKAVEGYPVPIYPSSIIENKSSVSSNITNSTLNSTIKKNAKFNNESVETKNVSVETKNVSVETKNVSVETKNVSVESKNANIVDINNITDIVKNNKILLILYSKIDIGYIINNYIAGILAIVTYTIFKKRILKL